MKGNSSSFQKWDWILVWLLVWNWSENIHGMHCFPSRSADFDKQEAEHLLQSVSFIHMGGVVSSSRCPESGLGRIYFSGAKIRLSKILNQSMPTVNAIEFICSDGINAPVDAVGTLKLQQNVGTWSPIKECQHGGFITGITLYMESVSSESLVGSEDVNLSGRRIANSFDIFELGRTRFVSGMTLNCSFSHEEFNVVDTPFGNGSMLDGATLMPASWNMITLGRPTGMGLRLYCTDNRVMSGLSSAVEGFISYADGERWIPMEITSKCSILSNPVVHCYPELDWEPLNDMNCTNTNTGMDAIHPPDPTSNLTTSVNVSCVVPHFVGMAPNIEIENLAHILDAYRVLDLEGVATKNAIRSHLLSKRFQTDWQRQYKLTMKQYKIAVMQRPVKTYWDLKKEIQIINFTDVHYDEPQYCQKIRNKTIEPLHYGFSVKQLVGYCSIYKIHFPLFQHQFQAYFDRRISGIKSKIIFPQRDDTFSLMTFLQDKYGFD